MKKRIWLLAVIPLILLLGWLFREPIIDALPIDQSGWVERDGSTCFLSEKGDPLTGWQEINGKRFCFSRDGALLRGWLEDGGQRFYLTQEGTPAAGWQEIEGKTYYFDDTGAMRTGWITADGQEYYLLPSGTPASGAVEIEGILHRFSSDGTPLTGWQEDGGVRRLLDSRGAVLSGWQETGGRCYLLSDTGTPLTGWQEKDGRRFFLNEDGSLHTGWLEQDGKLYYLTEAGAARGKYTVDGTDYFFTSTGENIIVVNPWNYIPQGYEPELVNIYGRYGQVDASCAEELNRMLADCAAAGGMPDIAAAYRTHETQEKLHTRMLADYVSMGYSEDEAFAVVKQISAVPGTSEHQLGLAVDIVDSVYTKMDTGQLLTTTQIWLVEHCWEYGFILRYPRDATRWTGIVYEPWHYRYVGTELALELRDLGICLEEYLYNLTEE